MAHIIKRFDSNSIIDIANSNNNLLEKISPAEKKAIIIQVVSDIEKINDSPNYLKEIFL